MLEHAQYSGQNCVQGRVLIGQGRLSHNVFHGGLGTGWGKRMRMTLDLRGEDAFQRCRAFF